MMVVNLMAEWIGLADKLRDAGVQVPLPAYLGWADEWSDTVAGAWYPETGRLYVARRIAHVPLLVRDVLTHEVAHQIQYGFSGSGSGGGVNGGPHGDLFSAVATRVAGILGCPSPTAELIREWPHAQRPEGYYGPQVRRVGA
ncbi:hypothetical protein DLJ47_01840 [Micromonospora sp. S4605]|nr:hypothetical protein DLJ47_01840 [Micromonospora sp. S4605]